MITGLAYGPVAQTRSITPSLISGSSGEGGPRLAAFARRGILAGAHVCSTPHVSQKRRDMGHVQRSAFAPRLSPKTGANLGHGEASPPAYA